MGVAGNRRNVFCCFVWRAAACFNPRTPHRRKFRSNESDDAETPLAASAGSAPYHDFDVAAEQVQELHESLCGETRKLPAEEAGDFWLINFQYPGGVCLS